MELLKDEDISELFGKIKKYVKSISESLTGNDTESAMKSLNKINIIANYGSASMLYKASLSEE